MRQGTLFDDPPRRELPPHNRTATSTAAAVAIDRAAPRLRSLVYRFIAGRGEYGATDQECQLGLALSSQTQGPRRVELERSGHVRDSGERRPTLSGRKAIVWVATDKTLCSEGDT
jgi:hypothetical protein